jgi:pimeloyl-ACP methyl ester carboxylesterase
MSSTLTRVATAATAAVAMVATVALAGTAASPAAAGPAGRHPISEAQRVDRVPTPKPNWQPCNEIAECATVPLPLDYDQPAGATIKIAVLRIKAKDQKRKIGSLFLNPGGPGGSGTEIALAAPAFLSPSLLERFDIVGVDPRGIGDSENLRCFPSVEAQEAAYAGMNVAFPYTRSEEAAYIKSAKAIGKGCSTYGRRIAGAMSTAEVVRDMEVMRRAVGDSKLNYLGFSYGTAIGQYYANMFPDRFRALVVDGVINPETWVGNRATKETIQDDRLRSADGAFKALKEILKRCDRAGEAYCAFAAGNPGRNFETIARELRAEPLEIADEFGTYTITYADFVGAVLGLLYGPTAGADITALAAELYALLTQPATAAAKSAKSKLVKRIRDARSRASARAEEPYDNGIETYGGVACTDGLHPSFAESWPRKTARSDRRAPYFGRAWAWGTAMCADNAWSVRDEDAYTGPFRRRTSAPVLVVGSFWDPATNYDDAVTSSRLLPNSRLLSSTNWGHTAYGTGACATTAIDDYLLSGKLPRRGTVCEGEIQPFTDPLLTDAAATDEAARAQAKRPPVATPVPESVLNGNR